MKQATHIRPIARAFRVRACEWGGFIVYSDSEQGLYANAASFTTADECADWLRGVLRGCWHDQFGAKKP
jgi:hypothetical protein